MGAVIVGVVTMTTEVEGGIIGVDIMEGVIGITREMMIWVHHSTVSTGLSHYMSFSCLVTLHVICIAC